MDLALSRPLADELAQTPDDFPAAQCLLGGDRDQGEELLSRLGAVKVASDAEAGVQVVDDGGERLVDLVRDRGRHLAHLVHARQVRIVVPQRDQPFLAFAARMLQRLALADVLDDGDEEVRLAGAGADQRHRQAHPDDAAVLAHVALVHDVAIDLARQHAVDLREIERQVVDVSDLLEAAAEQLRRAVARDLAHGVVDPQPSSAGGDMGDAHRGRLERGAKERDLGNGGKGVGHRRVTPAETTGSRRAPRVTRGRGPPPYRGSSAPVHPTRRGSRPTR